MSNNPYETPFANQPPSLTPHRGTLILVFGIVSIAVSLICCLVLPLPVGMGFGIPAWLMGRNDLKRMANREIDSNDGGTTKAGMICGIIGSAIGLLGVVIIGGVMVFAIVGGAMQR